MAEITVFGASDDLLEIEGSISEEFDAYVGAPFLAAFGDGTLAKMEYDEEGMWRISVIIKGRAKVTHKAATDPDDDYSDKLTLKGDIRWVNARGRYVRVK